MFCCLILTMLYRLRDVKTLLIVDKSCSSPEALKLFSQTLPHVKHLGLYVLPTSVTLAFLDRLFPSLTHMTVARCSKPLKQLGTVTSFIQKLHLVSCDISQQSLDSLNRGIMDELLLQNCKPPYRTTLRIPAQLQPIVSLSSQAEEPFFQKPAGRRYHKSCLYGLGKGWPRRLANDELAEGGDWLRVASGAPPASAKVVRKQKTAVVSLSCVR